MRTCIVLLAVAVLIFLPFDPGRDAQAQTTPANFQTHHDTIPNFAQSPTIQSTRNGSWFSTATWSPARLPQAGDVVLIKHAVAYDGTTGDAGTIGIDSGGTLAFKNDRATQLKIGTLLVMPGGTLEVGTVANPIAANVTAEIVIKNISIDLTNNGVGVYDPDQYGTGLLVVDGTIRLHGAAKTPTFVRTGKEPRAGDTSLTLERQVSGWQVGDRFSLPDTRHLRQGAGEVWSGYVPQWEEFSITAISGNVITLSNSLRFDHLGARNADGLLEFLPHVANLSRNVKVRSESPAGTRGHILVTNKATMDIRYAELRSLGRTTNANLNNTTNHIGRYAMHLHHLLGPANPQDTGYQFQLIGNAMTDSTKWPIAVHNSHYGLIKGNTVYKGTGAGIVTEDGNESYNEFIENFVMAIEGDVNPRNNDGRDGSVFWFTGFNHIIRNNVAANGINRSQGSSGSGYNIWWTAGSSANTQIPLYRGADIVNGLEGREYRRVNMQFTPIPEFAGNEVYGATQTGLFIWHLGTDGYVSNPNMGETIIKDFTGWHLFGEAFWAYPINRVTFDGFVVRGSSRAFGIYDYGTAWQSGDYWAENVTIRRADIQGMQSGICCSINTPGTFKIENSYFRTYQDAISIETLATPGTRAAILPRKTEIRNVTFEAWPGRPLQSITMNWNTSRENTNTTQKDEVYVYAYQGNSTDNFRAYYTEQATQNVAGGRAPCTATRPEIDGLVCPIAGSPGGTAPLAAPTNVRVSN